MALAYGYVKAKVVSAPTLKATRHHKETRGFVHRPGNDSNDHNDIWQDGALSVDVGKTSAWPISRRSTSSTCRPTTSAIRSPERTRSSRLFTRKLLN